MQERTGLITMKGNPLTLLGSPIETSYPARDFKVLNTDLEPVTLSSLREQILIFASVPSLDTSVCSEETNRFNAEAAKLSKDISVLTISMDLPFAQKRWVDENKATSVTTLSDHKDASFGMSYGVLIKELRLLARAVFVIGRDRHVAYTELVPEVTDPPDYEAALKAARELV
jgi:thiol peroxidase